MAIERLDIDEIILRDGWNIRDNAADDIDSLAESMDRSGQLHPLIITADRELLAGHRRYFAAKKLGWKKVSVTYHLLDETSERLTHLDENLERQDLPLAKRDEALAEKYALFKTMVRSGDKKPTDFIDETTEQTGLSKTTVYRGVKRHDNASDQTWEAYICQEIGSIQLDQLIKLPKKAQDKIISMVKRYSASDTKKLVSEELALMNVPPDFAVRHPKQGTMHVDKFLKVFVSSAERILDCLDCFDDTKIEDMIDEAQWNQINVYVTDIKNALKCF